MLFGCQAELPPPGAPDTGRAWVEASARYHDPEGRWPAFRAAFTVTTLPAGADTGWTNELYLDRVLDTFSRTKLDGGYVLTQTLNAAGECGGSWPNPSASPARVQRLGLDGTDCRATVLQRQFREFLVGLPMSALEGEPRFDDEVARRTLGGLAIAVVQVEFADDPTGPVWELYVEESTHRLVGSSFRTPLGEGERILYPEDTEFEGFRVKAVQEWFQLRDGRPISTDTLAYRAIVR